MLQCNLQTEAEGRPGPSLNMGIEHFLRIPPTTARSSHWSQRQLQWIKLK